MRTLYTIGIHIYRLLILLAVPFNTKARLFIRGRKRWKKNLAEKIPPGQPVIWFHCASLGEFEQGRPVIERTKKELPDTTILLTFISPSGYEVRKNYEGADIITYLPLDTPSNVNAFYNRVQPVKIFFVKYEFWYNYILEARRRQIPVYIISAIFRPGQFFFRKNIVGRWYQNTLRRVDHFFVQNEESERLLQKIHLTHCTVSGDTRFDRVFEIASRAGKIPGLTQFKDGKPLVIAGSTWPPDEKLLLHFINQSEGVKFILAPHEVSESSIKRIINQTSKSVVRFSERTDSQAARADLLLIDSVGLLSTLYQYGDISYIGGGFGVGIHNILEAATFGLPIIFGPNFNKFKEAKELVALGGAFPVTTYEELERILSSLLQNSDKRCKLSDLLINYVNQNRGATRIIIKKTLNF
jgi:3-deoxy-D-manno-octulosonic-acid transferase